MSRDVPIKDIKLLYSLSAGRCNLCRRELFEPKIDEQGYIHIGEMAHIYPYSDNEFAPRYIDGLSGNNSYDNLILLCGSDHIKVDSNPAFYTVEKLHKIKQDFESHISFLLSQEKNSKDKVLIDLIAENFELQKLVSLLDMPLNCLPWCIGDIADIENWLLIPNCPSLYPFDDKRLNQIMENMLINYQKLHPYVMEYYFHYNEEYLAPVREKPISDIDKAEILEIVADYRKSIYEWLEYCRFNYS